MLYNHHLFQQSTIIASNMVKKTQFLRQSTTARLSTNDY